MTLESTLVTLKLVLCMLLIEQHLVIAGLILGLHPANERRRSFVTTSHTGGAQAWNQLCKWTSAD